MFNQGKFVKTSTIISDQQIQNQFKNLLREMNDEHRTPSTFQKLLNTEVLKNIDGAPGSISTETARRWMHLLGFKITPTSNGYYTDSHNRKDIIEYRAKFLEEMKSYESRMVYYDGENMDNESQPNLLHMY